MFSVNMSANKLINETAIVRPFINKTCFGSKPSADVRHRAPTTSAVYLRKQPKWPKTGSASFLLHSLVCLFLLLRALFTLSAYPHFTVGLASSSKVKVQSLGGFRSAEPPPAGLFLRASPSCCTRSQTQVIHLLQHFDLGVKTPFSLSLSRVLAKYPAKEEDLTTEIKRSVKICSVLFFVIFSSLCLCV